MNAFGRCTAIAKKTFGRGHGAADYSACRMNDLSLSLIPRRAAKSCAGFTRIPRPGFGSGSFGMCQRSRTWRAACPRSSNCPQNRRALMPA